MTTNANPIFDDKKKRESPELNQAMQAILQSSAMMIQDATQHVRSVQTIGATAMGMAMANMLNTGDVATFSGVIAEANSMIEKNIDHYERLSRVAIAMAQQFPAASPASRTASTTSDNTISFTSIE